MSKIENILETKHIKKWLLLVCLSSVTFGSAQQFPLDSLEVPEDYENIYVQQISGDSLSSAFLICIKEEVKLHKHLEHSEHVYVLEGSGDMQLGDSLLRIKAGDLIFIPKNTPHKVRTTSDIPLKVLSIQSPAFDGTDRVLLE